ncbi:N-acetylglucosamine kinase-like BadF-type ATPase [Micromonospora pisi]|uniref:N-acetylglucosamine kinase-like BadF-type ATPase n=1 Tax=Micromonospora pisi TaxID=589240 RepID=A0A495JCP7_9ACTN|nr:BadF/BadG/BcrA/BcrD ATPase family protein [Micromonospora pisi]RKR86786.1 N-acetylglucosamine kinase-like BadF-type ATPase [Micromonospora pisi]
MPPAADPLVIGLDVGGSSTRAVVVSLTGEQLGSGVAGGGNPVSHGVEPAARQLRVALRAALAGLDPDRVRAGAIGLAGAGRLDADPAARAAYDHAWRDAGLRCRYAVHGDALVGYASATAVPDGTVLIAGTGAVAAQVHQVRLNRVADGHGWLLGDAGSGFWLGREAVRHTLAELDALPYPRPVPHRPPGVLAGLILHELLGPERVMPGAAPPERGLDPRQLDPRQLDPRQTVRRVIQTVTRRPPVELARLAPLVFQADHAGDPAAGALISSAAGLLVESVARIRPAGAVTPIVLGGGLLTPFPDPASAPAAGGPDTDRSPDAAPPAGGPLARVVGHLLTRRWPAAPLLAVGAESAGAIGAAWLAARTLPEVTDPVELHGRLLQY